MSQFKQQCKENCFVIPSFSAASFSSELWRLRLLDSTVESAAVLYVFTSLNNKKRQTFKSIKDIYLYSDRKDYTLAYA